MKNFIKIIVLSSPLWGLWSYAQNITIRPGKIDADDNNSETVFLRSTNFPSIIGVKINGTFASPSNVTNNQLLFSIEGRGYGGGTISSMRSGIRMYSSQNWTANNQGARMEFFTNKNGESTFKSRFIINQDGKVGIGEYLHSLNFLPDHQFEVQQPSDSDKGVGVYRFGGDAPTYFGLSANGNYLVPTATLNTHILARFGGKGYDGTGFTTARARIDMVANQNWTSTTTGAEMQFFTTQSGTTDVTPKMIIQGNGNVGIGDTTPEANLTVGGDMQFGVQDINFVDGDEFTALSRGGKSVIRFIGSGSGSHTVHLKGIQGGVDGMILHILSNNSTVKIYQVGSTGTGNGISFDTGGGWVIDGAIRIRPLGGCTLIYNSWRGEWAVLANN